MMRTFVWLCLASLCWSAPAGNGFPPGPPPSDPLEQIGYNAAVFEYLQAATYRKTSGWKGDKYWRLTGRMEATVPVDASGTVDEANIKRGDQFGVHPPCRIWYSPEVIAWMEAGYPDTPIADGAVIIKETTSWTSFTAELANEVPVSQRKPGDTARVEGDIEKDQPIGSWVVMVRHSSSAFDGWYWFDFSNVDCTGMSKEDCIKAGTYPYNEKGGTSLGWGAMPATPDANWTTKSPTDPPKYFTGNPTGNIVYPSYQYGAYCLNCHASAISNSTFSNLGHLNGTSSPFYATLNFVSDTSAPGVVAVDKTPHKENEASTKTMSLASTSGDDTLDNPYSPPMDHPNPLFVGTFAKYAPWTTVPWADVWEDRLPARTYDHAVSKVDGSAFYVTSDQCQGCHDASVLNSKVPNMQVEVDGTKTNFSPYGEWGASMMGLAGRDPIFYSQLESEQHYFPEMADEIANTCLKCHGAMGQRQFHMDQADKPEADQKLFTRAMMAAWPGSDNKEYERYGGLGRDGISCTVCHHIDGKDLGKPTTFTGNFHSGPWNELYGPFDDVQTKPMENAIGMTPKGKPWMTESSLCGSCHAIVLPVYNDKGVKVKEGFEQTTYLEWLNSVYNNEAQYNKQDNPEGASCQDCHMPNTYHSKEGEMSLNERIANIEGVAGKTTASETAVFPFMERALPNEDLVLKRRPDFARHSLAGINLFGLEMFRQFPTILGIMQADFMVSGGMQQALVTAQQAGVEQATIYSADISLDKLSKTTDTVTAEVTVVNKAGHFLPSGVGFRRAFVRFEILDDYGQVLWVSGETNAVGVIVDDKGHALPTEFLDPDPRMDGLEYQPHYMEINHDYQVQIYQELAKNPQGEWTTSFLQIYDHVKDNRLRPKGWSPDGPYAKETAPHGNAKNDPNYTDAALTGKDVILYKVKLPAETAAAASRVKATLFYQSIPPYYLMQRFQAAKPETAFNDIKRLYFMSSHLNTQDAKSVVKDWRIKITSKAAAL